MRKSEEKALAKAAGEMYYFSSRPCSRGHFAKRLTSTGSCTECMRMHSKRHYEDNKDKYHSDSKAWALNNPERSREISRKHYETNKTELKQKHLEWARRNKQHLAAKSKARECLKLKRIPVWADLDAIREFYKLCPEGYHVDHIIPLQAEKASGLHVLENLQYLPAFENISKRNKFEPC